MRVPRLHVDSKYHQGEQMKFMRTRGRIIAMTNGQVSVRAQARVLENRRKPSHLESALGCSM
jgi:hypothetical protein